MFSERLHCMILCTRYRLRCMKLKPGNEEDVTVQDGMQNILCKIWSNDSTESPEVIVGDTVQMLNMTVNRYRNRMSLNSTPETKTVVCYTAIIYTISVLNYIHKFIAYRLYWHTTTGQQSRGMLLYRIVARVGNNSVGPALKLCQGGQTDAEDTLAKC